MRTLHHLLLAASAVALISGCSSNPTADQPAAPIENRGGGTTTPGGPGTGTVPGGGTSNPNAIDLTQKPAATGVDPRVKQGILAQRSVYFAFDSDAIGEKFRPMLQAHAAYLSGNRQAKMLVQGNTDERGSREYNLALGQRRAEAVKKTLVLMGAGEAQVEAVSLGEEKPRRTGRSDEDYAENRRGDILYGGEF
jgi:peptidoglycan-associated lipoprotein